MFVRKTLAALTSLAMAGAGMLVLASPAHAAVTIDCTVGANPAGITGEGPFEFRQDPDTPCRGYNVRTTSIGSSDISIAEDREGDRDWLVRPNSAVLDVDEADPTFPSGELMPEGLQITVASGASGTVYADFYETQYNTLAVTYTITIGGGGDDGGDGGGDDGGDGGDTPSGDSGSTDAVSGLGPHIQEFAMPETGTCDEAASEGLNWGGAASGGWGESWAQWVNDGEGGLVCTRTLAYNTSTAAWEVD